MAQCAEPFSRGVFLVYVVYLVIHDSGQVTLRHLLVLCPYPEMLARVLLSGLQPFSLTALASHSLVGVSFNIVITLKPRVE